MSALIIKECFCLSTLFLLRILNDAMYVCTYVNTFFTTYGLTLEKKKSYVSFLLILNGTIGTYAFMNALVHTYAFMKLK